MRNDDGNGQDVEKWQVGDPGWNLALVEAFIQLAIRPTKEELSKFDRD